MSLLLDILTGGLAFGLISWVAELINRIKQGVRQSDAFYAEIKRVQPHTLTVHEIDEEGDTVNKVKYHSEERITDEFHEGQKIYA
jgi:hypothetical protein